jgi:hypothetical protein
MRLTNSGENFLRTETQRDALELAEHVRPVVTRYPGLEAEFGVQFLHHLPRAQVAGEEDEAVFEVDRGVVAQAQVGAVEDAQQQAHHGGGGLLDLIEQDDRRACTCRW